jgi:hypothetical protein
MKSEGGLVAVSRKIKDYYQIRIVMRGFHQSSDDYHATVTRLSDDAQLIFIAKWKWQLDLQTKRPMLDLAFKQYDKRERKLFLTQDRIV